MVAVILTLILTATPSLSVLSPVVNRSSSMSKIPPFALPTSPFRGQGKTPFATMVILTLACSLSFSYLSLKSIFDPLDTRTDHIMTL